MRIVPVAQKYNSGINNFQKTQTQFEKKDAIQLHRANHQYTGEASVDLAYASMFDSAIAKDLKLMGLI